MAEVTLGAITKTFDRVPAVEALAFSIREAELFVLLGPTGAGKSTTLRLVAGLETPDAGSVSIGGRDVTRMAPAERDVAFVFQQYSLYPHLTVFDNLAFPLQAPGRDISRDDIRGRVGTVAARVRIDHKLESPVTRLSGGEMQRVAIGRALVREPAVFLMDEPLSSLDAKLREEMRVELKHLQTQLGATILYVTHDQVEAMTLADRVGVLIEGQLCQVGTPREVYETPVDMEVALQVGALPVNLIPAARLGLSAGEVEWVGLRPENVTAVAPALAAPDEPVAGVDRVERFGAEDVVTATWRGITLRAVQPPALSAGIADGVALRADATGLMLFDGQGRRLAARSAALAALAPSQPVTLAGLGAMIAGEGATTASGETA